jgi:hypothetical protein
MTAETYATPFERGNQNQTTTLVDCMRFYQKLAQDFPHVLRMMRIGVSDGGIDIWAGLISADQCFSMQEIHAANRPIFFNNNGIHPGEPEGIDACMALVRDFCVDPKRLAALGQTVFLFIPIYNVDGCRNRANTSRVNQDGPEQFGFRANALNLDLNRDFMKCDSLAAQAFNQFFSAWSPDVMVDTHTSNGADYAYTMTLIQTQADKLGGVLGNYLRNTMLPALYHAMDERGWPMCPYVNPIRETPDDGIVDFLETPRFSTGYASLHHCIGFMPETHMLKPFKDRYAAMRALLDSVLEFTQRHGAHICGLRQQMRASAQTQSRWPLRWRAAEHQPSQFNFHGYTARYEKSAIGDYQRLRYDRSAPWEKLIPYHEFFEAEAVVIAPIAYLIPQAWRAVLERLRWNGVAMQRLDQDQSVQVQCYRVQSVTSRPNAYEGHLFYDDIALSTSQERIDAHAGDVLITLQQRAARYIVEALEPLAHDSFFRWGFFNSVLEKKESYSDYVFEDTAAQLLQQEPELAAAFAAWKIEHPAWVNEQARVLDFLFQHAKRHQEPEHRRYPIYRFLPGQTLPSTSTVRTE